MTLKNIALPLVAVTVALGQTASVGLSAVELAHLRADYDALNGQTYTNGNPELRRTWLESPDRVPAVREQILRILRHAITRVASSPKVTEGQIRDAINGVQGDFSFGAWTDGTNTPFAHFFGLNGSKCLAVAYAILEGGAGIPDSKAFLDFYVRGDRGWKLQAVAGSDFRSSTYFVHPMTAGLARESWFLASGQRIGGTGALIDVRLYAFNGEQIRLVWKREGLIRGTVEVTPNSVGLEFFKEYRPLENIEPVREFLHITPNGLE
jgi:hypothetical protein